MTFSDVLQVVGSAGRFQLLHVVLIIIPSLLFPSFDLIQNFSAATPKHHCRVPWLQNTSLMYNFSDSLVNITKETLLRVAIPQDQDSLSSCSRYIRPQWQLMLNDSVDLLDHEVEPCIDGWEFDSSEFSSTIVTEWNLVCKQQALKQVAQSVYMGGLLAGGVVLGSLADKFGRRKIMLICNACIALIGTVIAFAPNLIVYMVARFFIGMALIGQHLNSFSLGLEWLDERHRVIFVTILSCSYTTGQFILAGLGHGIRNWRSLQLAVAIPYYFIFLFSWFHPESTRWLVLQGKYKDALKCFQKVAKINGKPFTEATLNLEILKKEMENEEKGFLRKTYTALDLIRITELRRCTLIMSLFWFTTSFVYFGIVLNLQDFGLSIPLLMVVFAVFDYPAKLLSMRVINIGRRICQGGFLLLAGSACICLIFVPVELPMIRTSIAIFGKASLSATVTILYLFTGEIYPTVIRQNGLGMASMMAEVGGVLAPVAIIIGEIYPILTPIIFGSTAFLVSFLAYFLPETRNFRLPDTIEELQQQRIIGSKTRCMLKRSNMELRMTSGNCAGEEL